MHTQMVQLWNSICYTKFHLQKSIKHTQQIANIGTDYYTVALSTTPVVASGGDSEFGGSVVKLQLKMQCMM